MNREQWVVIPLGIALAGLILFALSIPPVKVLPSLQNTVIVGQTNGGHGTGVLITPTKVLTAAHVFFAERDRNRKTNTSIHVITLDGERHSVSHTVFNKDSDLATLTLEYPIDIKPLQIDCRLVDIGESLTTIGHPLSMWFVTLPIWAAAYMEGVTIDVGKDQKHRLGKTVMVEGTILGGMSGAGVYAKDGKLVGILNLQLEEDRGGPSGLGALIPSTEFDECQA